LFGYRHVRRKFFKALTVSNSFLEVKIHDYGDMESIFRLSVDVD